MHNDAELAALPGGGTQRIMNCARPYPPAGDVTVCAFFRSRRRPRSLAAAETMTDDGAVMQLSDQTLVELAVLTLTDIVWSALTASLVTDYRGSLTSYAHRCWLFYQRPWYQRMFLWTSSSRAYYADEARVRRNIRLAAVPGLAAGLLVLAIEFTALITGHVI